MIKVSKAFRATLMMIGGIVAATLVFIVTSKFLNKIFGSQDTWDSIVMWQATIWLGTSRFSPLYFLCDSFFAFAFFIITISIAGNLMVFTIGSWVTGKLLGLFTIAESNSQNRKDPYWWIFTISACIWTIGFIGVVLAAWIYPQDLIFDQKHFDRIASIFGPISGISSYIFLITAAVWLSHKMLRWIKYRKGAQQPLSPR